MKKVLVIIGIVIFSVTGYLGRLTILSGEWKNIRNESSWKCEKIPGISGPEDIVINHKMGYAYISAGHWREKKKNPLEDGEIFRYDLKTPSARPEMMKVSLPHGFHPHGLDLYVAPDGSQTLFVINHRNKNAGKGKIHAVEIFRIQDGTLTHMRTVTGELMVSPNDIAAMDDSRFFVTNDHGSRTNLGKAMEDYLRLRRSNVAYYNGTGFSIPADGFLYANGIHYRKATQQLYVTETTGKKLSVFQWEEKSGTLRIQKKMDLDTGLDNLDFHADGSATIAAHPKLLRFVRHAGNEKINSPSQVIRLEDTESGDISANNIYMNTGEEISGSSVGVQYKDRLLIGAVFEHHFLDCQKDVKNHP